MTFEQYLTRTGREIVPSKHPWHQHVLRDLLDRNQVRKPLRLIYVRSFENKTSVQRFRNEHYLVWDHNYWNLIVEFASALMFAPVLDCLNRTHELLWMYLSDFCMSRGWPKAAMHFTRERQEEDWSNLLRPCDPLEFYIPAEDAADVPVFRDFEEVDSLFARVFPNDRSELETVLNTQLCTMEFFVFAHEVAHYVLRQNAELRQSYLRKVTSFLNDPTCFLNLGTFPYNTILPQGVNFARNEDGRYVPDTGLMDEAVGRAYYSRCKDILGREEQMEEVFCDWFAIDFIVEAGCASLLAFAEVEQALWLSHQYMKYLGYIRHDILCRGGPSSGAADGLKEKHARGLLKLCRVRMLLHERADDEGRQQVRRHAQAINWVNVMFSMKQDAALLRFALQPSRLGFAPE
jgi:hypothetical protein